eukprot:TRINITY_DN2044_c3_g1_i1.p1 TRINITY_DN2044_c3_g1~~TRINITY_DN2044_c3_g1_i1.p1  ORF type:complete len:477 (-),score=159.94 TRINITY_DN2044_c3_g1_i1:86-1516(-)
MPLFGDKKDTPKEDRKAKKEEEKKAKEEKKKEEKQKKAEAKSGSQIKHSSSKEQPPKEATPQPPPKDANDSPPPVTRVMSSPKLNAPAPSMSDTEDPVSFGALINNANYMDVLFILGPAKINAHQCIIESRCVGLLKNGKKKKNVTEVEIPPTVSVTTFLDIMAYIYTGKVPYTSRKDEEIVLLMAASEKFEGLERLHWECEHQLRERITMTNAHRLLKLTDDLKLKFKEYVLQYCVAHYTEFIGNKAATKEIGIELLQEAVQAQQAKSAIPAEPAAPNDTFINDFKALYDTSNSSQSKFTDVQFKLMEMNIVGVSGLIWKAHKAIIAGRAPGLQSLLATYGADSKNPAIPIKGFSPECFEALMKYLYYGDRNIPTKSACELVEFARQYGMGGLLRAVVDSMRRGISKETVLTIMDVGYTENMPQWYEEAMKELRPRCVRFLVENLTEIDFEKIREKKMNRAIAPAVLIAIQKLTQ